MEGNIQIINDFIARATKTEEEYLRDIPPISCYLCDKMVEGWGHNPYPLCPTPIKYGDPLNKSMRCCNHCNERKVLPMRILNRRKRS